MTPPPNNTTTRLTTSPHDAAIHYLKTYLQPAPVQDANSATTDPQLSSMMLAIVERMNKASDGGVLIDIGCGRGALLQRLLDDAAFARRENWLYVGIDIDENLDIIQKLARRNQIARRVELQDLGTFYDTWPSLGAPQFVVCRNVFHELTVAQTAQLLSHVSANSRESDAFLAQDLMNFPQGERHNACWFPTELENCLREHEFGSLTTQSVVSKSGARWFNIIAERSSTKELPTLERSLDVVRSARLNQWAVWAEIEKTAATGDAEWSQVVAMVDLDLQLAALTRQLRDVGAFVELDTGLEKRLRARELAGKVESFVQADTLSKQTIAERVRLRERGEQLNVLEEFLRGPARLAAVLGGGGTGKTACVEHLLATRSYGKSPVVINAQRVTDVWSLVESVFAQVGLRLAAERLSVLSNIGWQALEVPLRRFVNRFSSHIILFIDNFDSLIDTNGAIQDRDIGRALAILAGPAPAKLLIAQRGSRLPDELLRASGSLNPPTVRLHRFATDETVVNILDDRFDRSAAGVENYPPRLLRAIDRHPLGATLTSEILHKHGRPILTDDRFLLELEQRLNRELWGRLVDKDSIGAVQMASELRVPVPQRMLEALSSFSAVAAGLASSALYALKDRRWEELISTLATFRRRRIDDEESDESVKDADVGRHQAIADHYLSIYQRDDDPKWIRESYFHRMLAGGIEARVQLGQYYVRELLASADYCFYSRRDYSTALELYTAAGKATGLPEEAKMHHASCRVRTGDRPGGDAEFEQWIRAYPANRGMRTSFVDALLFVHDFATARRKLEELGLDPDQSDWVAGQWGRVWLGLNSYKQAETMFRKQLAAKPLADPQVFLNLARALQYQGAVGEALAILERGHALHPADLSIETARGASLERLRRDDDALVVLEPLFQARPDRSSAALPMIKIWGRRGNPHKARSIFDFARKHALDPLDSVLVTAEAEVLKSEGRPEAAMHLLRERGVRDQHTMGMLMEVWFHHAQSKPDPIERARIAREALAEEIPENLRMNVPLLVNRARLAVLAGDRKLFETLREEIRGTRAEMFEIENLDRTWESNNKGTALVG